MFLVCVVLSALNLWFGFYPSTGEYVVFGPGFHFWMSGALAVFAFHYYLDWHFGVGRVRRAPQRW